LWFIYNRYEGPRTAEALAEFVNNEGGTAFSSFFKLIPPSPLSVSDKTGLSAIVFDLLHLQGIVLQKQYFCNLAISIM
jgi:hypothetical protein